MALKIPPDFDAKTQALDENETVIRDVLGIEITNWAKFRHTIDIGNEASKLKSLGGVIPESVKDAYRNLAKSHYEVVMSLGNAHLSAWLAFSYDRIDVGGAPRTITFMKSLKDCYFHIGCMLDNLARLIYILNDMDSPNATSRFRRELVPIRYTIDWGNLAGRIREEPTKYAGYTRLPRSRHLLGIVNIRNAVTHDWLCPILIIDGVPWWPLAIRSKRNFLWYYDESHLTERRYRKGAPVQLMVQRDLQFITAFQNMVFGKLIHSVKKFERAHNLVIT